MKKILLLLAVMMAAAQLMAAPVDLATAKLKAKQCVNTQVRTGKKQANTQLEPTLVLTEMGKQNPTKPVYYIFNTDQNFVIVAGDDRAEEILAVGDRPLNVDRMPDNMKAWLNGYREQIDYLFSNPNIQVEKPFKANLMLNATTVEPLLTALWDQDAPYNNMCQIGGYSCLTGCPATSASMVFYFWKYPVDPTPVVPGYRCELSYSWWSTTTVNVPSLPSVTFDWDNMLDRYSGNYNSAQANAVATLMRYVGQAERMQYGTYSAGGSGVDADSVSLIADAFKFFGYDENTVRAVKKTSAYSGGRVLYTDAEWAEMMQEELYEGRPIVYCAISNAGGHAFNVDGYDAESNKYHVNYGWSGDGNGDFALNAFRDGTDTFNQYQQMVIGIQPGYQGPAVLSSTRNINMQCFTGETATATFTVKGRDLVEDVTVTLDDENGVFTLDAQSVSVADTPDGKEVTVTFAPQQYGEFAATVTLTSADAREAVVKIQATATLLKEPVKLLEPENIEANSFVATWSDDTPEQNVSSYTLVVHQDGFEVAEEVAKADFAALNYTGMQADPMSDFDTYCTPEGWTGETVYPDKGCVRLGHSTQQYVGSLNTPALDLSRSGGKLTITFKAKSYGGASGELIIKVGEHSYTQVLKTSPTSYTVVLDCEEDDAQTVTFTNNVKRVEIYNATITTTDVTTGIRNAPSKVEEQGDSIKRTITGITDKSYNVTGLTAGASYYYKVKAFYIDGSESHWTKNSLVTLAQDGEPIKGDINGDGVVDVADVNILINIVLGSDSAENYGNRAYVTDDDIIDVADINAVINIMLLWQ